MWEELVGLQREQLGEDHVATLATMNNLATVYSMLGREADSLALHEQVVAVRRRVLPVGHPSLVRSLQNYGTQLVRLGRIEEGAAAIEEALETSKTTLKPDDQQTLTMLIHLANVRRKQERYDEAIELASRAHAGLLSKFTADDQRTLSAVSVWVGALCDAARFADALERLRTSGHPLPESQAPELRRSFHILAARALLGLDRLAESKSSLDAARRIVSPPLGASEEQRIIELDAQLRARGH